MTTLFYLFCLVLIANEVFYIINRKKIDLIFDKREMVDIKLSYIFYFLIKTVSYIWPIIGVFSGLSSIFLCIIGFGAIRFAAYHINRRLYNAYTSIMPFINIALYLLVLICKLKG